jgi:hypothetical protein
MSTTTAIKQELYNPPASDLQHDLQGGFVELADIIPCQLRKSKANPNLEHTTPL